jgi:hypothetical protein
MVKMEYKTGKDCPECGKPEGWVLCGKPHDTFDKRWIEYSCEHFKAETELSRCRFCGKPGAKCKQVPLPIPVSDVYCDTAECAEACKKHYAAMMK